MTLPFIVAVRHPKEKRAKCSLLPLEDRSGTLFRRSKPEFSMDGTGFLLLAADAPELKAEDAFIRDEELERFTGEAEQFLVSNDEGRNLRPILLLDSTWRLLPAMRERIYGKPLERSLPSFLKTAYPRVSKMTEDPSCGLATIEALYAALRIMGMDCPELLDGYRWKDEFLLQYS